MGNQQERSLAWVAGIVEGEGTISFQAHMQRGGNLRITPYICVVNQDRAILHEVKRVWDGLCAGKTKAFPRWCNAIDGAWTVRRACYNLRLDGTAVAFVVKGLLPHMIGEKRKNADAVLAYIKMREKSLLKRDPTTGRIVRQGYSHAEIDLVSSIRTHARAKSSETLRRAPNVFAG